LGYQNLNGGLGGGYETSGVSKMSIQLLLLRPNGDEHARLNMTQLWNSALAACLITGTVSTGELTPPGVSVLAERFAQFLANYRLNQPAFPRDALLQFSELGPYWSRLVLETEALYYANDPGFDAALEELMATVQVDMEEEHRIPYNKHRHYDTLLCFKAEYDSACWMCHAADIVGVPPYLQIWEYDYLAFRLGELQKAVAAGCGGQWVVG
jgi:hypothetical protein